MLCLHGGDQIITVANGLPVTESEALPHERFNTDWRYAMKRIHTVVAGAVAGVALAVAAAAFAQPFGGMGYGFGPGMGMGHRHGPMAGGDPSVMVDSHLADLKAQLKITAEQETAWQTFTAAAKQQAAGMQAMRAADAAGSGHCAGAHGATRDGDAAARGGDGDDDYRVQCALFRTDTGTKGHRRPELRHDGPSRHARWPARRLTGSGRAVRIDTGCPLLRRDSQVGVESS